LVFPSGAKTTQDKDWFGFVINSHTTTVSAAPQHMRKFDMFELKSHSASTPIYFFGSSKSEAGPRLAGMTDKVDVIWSNHGLGTQGSAGHGNSLPCAKKDGSKPVHGPTIVDSLPFLCIFLFSLWQCKYHQSTQW